MTPAVAAAREFPDTSDGIFVFDDQLDTSAMSDAQFAFAATHEVRHAKDRRQRGAPVTAVLKPHTAAILLDN